MKDSCSVVPGGARGETDRHARELSLDHGCDDSHMAIQLSEFIQHFT